MNQPVSSFVFPTVVPLPLGYDCTFPLDIDRIGAQIAKPEADLNVITRRYYEGKLADENVRSMRFKNGKLISERPEPLVWSDASEREEAFPSFAEIAMNSADDTPVFSNRMAVSNYSVYTKPGKKAFFSDNAFKYGSPSIISLMGQLGRFVEGYPAIHLDKERDFGETLLFINPYLRPVLVRIASPDHRTPIKLRVPAQSVRGVPLIDFLREGETRWLGQIQLTANNRLITFHIRHSLRDSKIISDHEHLDPFRTEPTHLPLSQAMRISLGVAVRGLRRSISRHTQV